MMIQGPEDITSIRKHLDASGKERTKQQQKKYAQLRYERQALIKKKAADA